MNAYIPRDTISLALLVKLIMPLPTLADVIVTSPFVEDTQ